jgi:cell division ATPase FtsA
MEDQKISVGLDIGTTKIVAMIGRKNEYDNKLFSQYSKQSLNQSLTQV